MKRLRLILTLVSISLTALSIYFKLITIPWEWIGIQSHQGTTMQPATAPVSAPVYGSTQPSKPVNCDRIIKQIKSGKYVNVPPECDSAYQIYKEQEQARENREAQRAEDQRLNDERQAQERQNQLSAEAELRRQEEVRQAEQDRIRLQNEQLERERQERAEIRKQEQAERERREAAAAAERREQLRLQREKEKRDAIINLGREIERRIRKN